MLIIRLQDSNDNDDHNDDDDDNDHEDDDDDNDKDDDDDCDDEDDNKAYNNQFQKAISSSKFFCEVSCVKRSQVTSILLFNWTRSRRPGYVALNNLLTFIFRELQNFKSRWHLQQMQQ